ncbi:hypothetical protein CL654_02080 [bacterium]|nr:hypothetical protein [bacterium]|tara:strand:+ start:9231 stop:9704 length:474 start_codon:yes stop_codon:yes gene_type:complete
MPKAAEEYMIETLARGMRVFALIATSPSNSIGVTEIATTLDLQKNNVFRILKTLEVEGLVSHNGETDADKCRYGLGPKAIELGEWLLIHADKTVVEVVEFFKGADGPGSVKLTATARVENRDDVEEDLRMEASELAGRLAVTPDEGLEVVPATGTDG